MNIKKISRILFISIILIMLLASCMRVVYATSFSDLNEIDKKIQEKNNEIKEVKKEMSDAMTQISKITSEITIYENEIDDLDEQIQGLESQIALKESEIEIEEEKFKTQYELLKKRIVALYEMGDVGYLDILLSSGSLYELLSNYYLIWPDNINIRVCSEIIHQLLSDRNI